MLNALIANGDLESQKDLFKIYNKINDEKELLKISGKLLNKCSKLSKDDIIDVLDKCYDIIDKYREDFRALSNLIADNDVEGVYLFLLSF